MLLASESGDSFHLSIAGYEFPDLQSDSADEWDLNWLNVSGRVQAGTEAWSFVQPCLTTWEARELLGWLETAVHSRPQPIEFTEPNLEFRAGGMHESHRDIDLILRAESAPPHSSDDERVISGYTLTLRIMTDALAEAARAWRDDVAAHPAR